MKEMVVGVAMLAVVVCFRKLLAKMLRVGTVSSASACTDSGVMGQPCVD